MRVHRWSLGAAACMVAIVCGLMVLRDRPPPEPDVVVEGADPVNALVADGDGALWSTCHPTEYGLDGIWRGSTHERPALVVSGATCPTVVGVRGGELIYLEERKLLRSTLSGAGKVTLATEVSRVLAANRTHVFFASGRTVCAVPIVGGPAEELLPELPEVFAANDEYLVWRVGADTTTVRRMRLRDRTIIDLASFDRQRSPHSLLLDETEVFGASCGDDWEDMWQELVCLVWRMPLGGGTPQIVANQQNNPTLLTSDGQSIFWSEYLGEIIQLDKRRNTQRFVGSGRKRLAFAVGAKRAYWTAFRAVDGQSGLRDAILSVSLER